MLVRVHRSISCPAGTPENMKRLVGWAQRSATHQVFSRRRGKQEHIELDHDFRRDDMDRGACPE